MPVQIDMEMPRSCGDCILYQFCTYDRTGICEAENFKDVIPDKCRFCEKRWECPVEKGGECVKEVKDS